ncbi:hypothetical protein CspHIS471_0509550 [Cutaneotrichosporon sp. HIS471]|nr:hypothetical protein CspHIS471_0509550 [Cutaneotrichosporon sp. HIS471]
MADARKKQLAFNIIDFLRTSQRDGTVKEDESESLDIAIEVISSAFGVDLESADDVAQYSIKPASLLSLLDVLAKTKSKATSTGAGAAPAAPAASGPTEEDKTKADALKTKGNGLMSQKEYNQAIQQYTEAIKLNPNPVYYSNRAAAHGALNQHDKAVEDAARAIDLDPKFAKGYSRLGHAQFSLGEFQKAIDAYEAGLKLDPANNNMKSSLATAKVRLGEQAPATERSASPSAHAAGGGMPDLSSLASMLGGAGGGAGGAGGMPDLSEMMRNPQMMAMAQQMMANGGLERLMSNPNIRQMAENMQSGGGMPDFNQLASDPSLREMAQQFMGGQGGAEGATLVPNTPDSWSFQHWLDRAAHVVAQSAHLTGGNANALTGERGSDMVQAMWDRIGFAGRVVHRPTEQAVYDALLFSCKAVLSHGEYSSSCSFRSQRSLRRQPRQTQRRRCCLIVTAIGRLLRTRGNGESLAHWSDIRPTFEGNLDRLIDFMWRKVSALGGPHGSAIMNHRFAGPGTLVLGFLPTTRISYLNYEETNMLNQTYAAIVIEPATETVDDMTIDPADVVTLLERHLGKASRGRRTSFLATSGMGSSR